MKKENNNDINEGEPICEKCGSAKILENNNWVCPNCDTKINFFGDDNE